MPRAASTLPVRIRGPHPTRAQPGPPPRPALRGKRQSPASFPQAGAAADPSPCVCWYSRRRWECGRRPTRSRPGLRAHDWSPPRRPGTSAATRAPTWPSPTSRCAAEGPQGDQTLPAAAAAACLPPPPVPLHRGCCAAGHKLRWHGTSVLTRSERCTARIHATGAAARRRRPAAGQAAAPASPRHAAAAPALAGARSPAPAASLALPRSLKSRLAHSSRTPTYAPAARSARRPAAACSTPPLRRLPCPLASAGGGARRLGRRARVPLAARPAAPAAQPLCGASPCQQLSIGR